MSRRDDFRELITLVGTDHARVVDECDGWPGIAEIHTHQGWMRVAIHCGPITETGRGRDLERRFQNPGRNRPIRAPNGVTPLLVGLWRQPAGDPNIHAVLVLFDAVGRLGANTRFSLFMPLWQLLEARQVGWASHTSATGEQISALRAPLLPAFLGARQEGLDFDSAPTLAVRTVFEEDDELLTSDARARRIALSWVRAAGFGRRVTRAYGDACALCGLGHGLTEGAHILPAAAPNSRDEMWNAVCLCRNHHAAFDRHLLWMEPQRLTVKVHPQLTGSSDAGTRHFLAGTVAALRLPPVEEDRPRPQMFEARYAHFAGAYDWAA